MTRTVRIGLALGGGGARGLAHIPVIEALDEMGIRPAAIAGTSIGALVGAGMAAGMSGRAMRRHVTAIFAERGGVAAKLWELRPRSLRDLLHPHVTQIDAQRTLAAVLPEHLPQRFEDLEIPLTVVAADFYGWKPVSIDSGPLAAALAASAALPVLFRPVEIGGRCLVDGGAVNPLPFDLLAPDLDLVIAVDVIGGPQPPADSAPPGNGELAFGVVQLAMQTIIGEKMKSRRPQVLLRPAINRFGVLEFLKAKAILEAGDEIRAEVKREVARALE